MKLRKLIILCSFILSIQLISAIKPLTGNVNDFAKVKLSHITNIVQLTDSQKIQIEKKAIEYGEKILNRDSVTYYTIVQVSTIEYQDAVNQTLTQEQREKIKQNREERKKEAYKHIIK